MEYKTAFDIFHLTKWYADVKPKSLLKIPLTAKNPDKIELPPVLYIYYKIYSPFGILDKWGTFLRPK